MTTGCTISYSTTSVDLNSIGGAIGTSISFRFSNPVIYVDTVDDTSIVAQLGYNTQAINIGLLRSSFTFNFTLRDGPGTYNFNTPGSTNFEKLTYIARQHNPKTLTINGSVYMCHIDSLDVSWDAGKKDIGRASMTVTLTSNLGMA